MGRMYSSGTIVLKRERLASDGGDGLALYSVSDRPLMLGCRGVWGRPLASATWESPLGVPLTAVPAAGSIGAGIVSRWPGFLLRVQ